MVNLSSTLTLKLIDDLSKPARTVGQALADAEKRVTAGLAMDAATLVTATHDSNAANSPATYGTFGVGPGSQASYDMGLMSDPRGNVSDLGLLSQAAGTAIDLGLLSA